MRSIQLDEKAFNSVKSILKQEKLLTQFCKVQKRYSKYVYFKTFDLHNCAFMWYLKFFISFCL